MYAVFQMAGFQYRVDEGEVIRVPSMTTNPGSRDHGHRQPYTAIRINKIVSPKI